MELENARIYTSINKVSTTTEASFTVSKTNTAPHNLFWLPFVKPSTKPVTMMIFFAPVFYVLFLLSSFRLLGAMAVPHETKSHASPALRKWKLQGQESFERSLMAKDDDVDDGYIPWRPTMPPTAFDSTQEAMEEVTDDDKEDAASGAEGVRPAGLAAATLVVLFL